MASFLRYMRANPQVFALFVICVVLGLGMFVIVLYGIVTAGSTTTTGDPSGAIVPAVSSIAHFAGAIVPAVSSIAHFAGTAG